VLDGGSPSRRSAIFAGLFVTFTLVMFGLTFLSYSFYVKEGQRSRDNSAVFNAELTDDGDLQNTNGTALDIILLITITDMDPLRSVLKLKTTVDRQKKGSDAVNGTLLLGSYKSVQLSSKTVVTEQEASAMVDGDVSLYPFDTFTVDLPFAATKTDPLADTKAESLSWAALAYGVMQNFRFQFIFQRDPSSSIVTLTVNVRRSPTARGFSIFIVSLMWLLTLGAVTIAFQIFLRGREIPANKISAIVSLLFALPSVRNTQPAVPPIGTLLDTVGLFWNMVLVAMSAIYVMFTYVSQGSDPKRPAYGGGSGSGKF